MANLSQTSKLIDWSWWETEAFADVLERAVEGGVPCDSSSLQLYEAAAPLEHLVSRTMLPGVSRHPPSYRRASQPSVPRPSFSHQADVLRTASAKCLQAGFYKSLFVARFPSDLASVLLPRVLKHLGSVYREAEILEAMRRTLRCVTKMAPQAGWALIRTWCNAWATSVGTSRKSCIFGCAHCDEGLLNIDSLRHYLVCPLLWCPIVQLCTAEGNTSWSISPVNSLALAATNNVELHEGAINCLVAAVVVASDVYHSTVREGCGKSTELILRTVHESFRRLRVRGIINISFDVNKFQVLPRVGLEEPPGCLSGVTSPVRAPQRREDEVEDEGTPLAALVWRPNSFVHDERGFCEPVCNDLPPGAHHPNCSQYMLADC
jgi:hypothetical protein